MNAASQGAKMKKGFWAFFLTDDGRKITYFMAVSSSVGLFLLNWAPETFFLKRYQEFVQCYEKGIEKPVPKKVLGRLEKAMDLVKLHGFERELVQPFTVFGFDLFQAGSLKYRFGAIIGIPVNFSYDSPKDIKKDEIRFKTEPIKWDTKSGKLLEESLILSEDEQIFGLAKSILDVNNFKVFMNSLFPSVSFLMVYSVGRSLNMKMNLFVRHISVRFVMYSILGLFGFGSWCFMKDFNQVQSDAEVDKQLASLGPEYIDAGFRYYEKILKKNIAFRDLLGDNTYTAKGNINYFIRQKGLPLTVRKEFFAQQAKEHSERIVGAEHAVTV